MIDPDNCVIEMERVIAEARRENRPAYIVVPSDYALSPVMHYEARPLTLKSNKAALEKAVAAINERLRAAKSVIAFPAFTIARLGLQKEAQKAIEALGCPFAVTSMEKCIVDEGHPQFAGLYAGATSPQATREIVEGADVVLDLGGINLNDITTASYSTRLDRARFITIELNDVRIGDELITGVRLGDMLEAIAKMKPVAAPYRATPTRASPALGQSSDKITMAALYPRYADFTRAGDTVVLETGSSSLGLVPMTLADGVRVEAQVLWGSIGWATPAAFGAALADESRRTILITGEGSHQLTANEIGSMGRFGAKMIVFVLNNSGYLIERRFGGESRLDLQQSLAVEVRRIAAGARMRRLVHGARRDTRRTRRRHESGARQQIGRLYRDHRRENGHAARSCFRTRSPARTVRSSAVTSTRARWL